MRKTNPLCGKSYTFANLTGKLGTWIGLPLKRQEQNPGSKHKVFNARMDGQTHMVMVKLLLKVSVRDDGFIRLMSTPQNNT